MLTTRSESRYFHLGFLSRTCAEQKASHIRVVATSRIVVEVVVVAVVVVVVAVTVLVVVVVVLVVVTCASFAVQRSISSSCMQS